LSSNTVLAIDEALRIGLQWSPVVVQARQALVSADQQVRQARSAYLPTADTGAGVRRATSNSGQQEASGNSSKSYSASVSADLLLYDFGRTPAAVREVVLRLLAAEARLRASENSTAYQIRTGLYDLLRAQELLIVAQENERQYKVRLGQVRALAEVGRRIKYDITKAEVDLGNAEVTLIDARNAVRTARATLNRRLGLAEEPGYRVADPPAVAPPAGFEDLMKAARERQPELASLRAEEKAASAVVDQAVADLYPSLRASGEYGWGGGSFPLIWNWAAGLSGSLNLFSGWRKTSRVDQSVAQLRSARAATAEREQRIYEDLSRAWAQSESARERQSVTELTVRQARETLELVVERYRLGKASSVELTDAQVALTTARAEQVRARFDYLSAVAAIQYTIGEK
jgi:outer membrane protein TolC